MEQFFFDLQTKEQPKNSTNDSSIIYGRKRIRTVQRNQIKFNIASIDQLIPEDHWARDVWEFVCRLDLSSFNDQIKVLENCKGPGTVDPKIYMSVWLYAILNGEYSARAICRLCYEHHAYIWLCGGVSVNYHSLSDFRSKNDNFRQVLQESIALMWKMGIFSPNEVAQDGTRVKANAGIKSLRKTKSLNRLIEEASSYVEKLEKEQKENPSIGNQRKKMAQERAIKERKERLEKAHKELEAYKEQRVQSAKKNHNKLTEDGKEELRISTTDIECRKMKMGDGGFHLAYNVQFATSTDKKVILGVDVVNTLDPGTLNRMMREVHENLKKIGCPQQPEKWLVDSAYANNSDLEKAQCDFPEVTIYSPPTSTNKTDPLEPKKNDNNAMRDLRKRMSTEEAQMTYKKRSSTAEFSNACTKNRGMDEFLVRGLKKVKNMALLYGIMHNMMMYFTYFQ